MVTRTRGASSPEDPGLRVTSDDAITTLTIDRPDRRNALSWSLVREMRRVLSEIREDPATRVVVLTGAGEAAFCAGADLDDMAGDANEFELHLARGELAGLFRDMWALGKPTIAAVRGYALAGGFGLALSCDFVVAADDAVFGAPEVKVGLWPYMITIPLLRSLPPRIALELMMTGRNMDAAEAERWGVVNKVVPPEQLWATTRELAGELASKSQAVLRLGRDSFYSVLDVLGERALDHLHAALGVAARLEDASEGIAAFKEKRRPRWRDR